VAGVFAAFTLALVWACVGVVVPAFGAETRVYQSSFGFFTEPEAVTVDGSGTASNGDVYVVDIVAGTVSRFTAAGIADDFSSKDADISGNSITGFSFEANAAQVAVAPAGSPGGTAGDIYVVSDLTNNVAIFDADGNHVGELNGSGDANGGFGEACGVATEASTGAVYVGDFNGHVWRYTPTTGTVSETDYSGGIETAIPVCNVAADSGNVYAGNTYSDGELRKYLASDFTTAVTPPAPSSTLIDAVATAVATDPSNGDVYVDEGNKISVFDSTGAALYAFGSEADFGSNSGGVAVKGSGGGAYVADRSAGQIDVFGSPVNSIAAATNPATAIGHTTATLNGHLDPGGDPSITDCHFDWGTDESYGHTAPCTEGSSFTAPADVHADLIGLHPGTTYHYRLNITGSSTVVVQGADQSLTTTAFPITTDAATNLHHTDVLLNGHFDPQSDPNLDVTACSFDWGTDTNYSGGSVPCAEGQSFSSPSSVSALLNDLTPGTTYHYRLHLTTGDGQVTGQDQTVTPPNFPTSSTQIASFGPDGTSSTSFGALAASGLAFDQTHRSLFAVDGVGIYGFEASAAPTFSPLAGFNPLASSPAIHSVVGIAVDNTALGSAGNIYLVDENADGSGLGSGKIFGFNSSGASLGGHFPIDPAVNPGSPVGLPKDVCGAAVDSDGALWVANFAANRVLRYSSTGVFLSSLDVSAQTPGPCNLAFDSHDNLYVSKFYGATFRYTAVSGYTAATEVDSGSAVGLVIDPSTDDLYVAEERDIKRYDVSGVLQGSFATGISDANFKGVTVDDATHDVYVADGNSGKIHVFAPPVTQRPPTLTPGDPTAITSASATLNAKVDPEGFQITDCHFEWGATSSYGNSAPCTPVPGLGSGDVAVHADLTGLNGGSTYHFRIVTANAQPGGSATGPDQSLITPGPAISATSTSGISDTAATLHANVNPNGRSTTYSFEYGANTSYGDSVPAAPAAIGSGSSDIAVAEQLVGLQPGATYHVRLTAQSSDGVDHGPDSTFTTFMVQPGFSSCPNDALRTGPGADLPDCRAYEQVSPVDKDGASVVGRPGFNQAAADGHAVVFGSYVDLPTSGGTSRSPAYVASRGTGSWTYDGALPSTGPVVAALEFGRDEDLQASLSEVIGSGVSIVLTDLTDFSPQLIVPSFVSSDSASPDPQFADDTDHFIFEDPNILAPGAVQGALNLYDSDHGNLTLAGMVPVFPATSCSGRACVAPAGGSFAGSYNTEGAGDLTRGTGYKQDTISDDGSRVFFTEGATGRLYMRENGTSTVQISAAQGVTDPNGHKPAAFWAATPSGSEVFFTSCEKLTADATAVSTTAETCLTQSQGQDLYAYDTQKGDLSDLTVDANVSDAQRAGVQGVLGASPDGAYVYFAANGVLAPGAIPGNCDTSSGELIGSCSVYLYHAGRVILVARLGANGAVSKYSDYLNWAPSLRHVNPFITRRSRVAADGTLLFSSTHSLTGYDNISPGCSANGVDPVPCAEFYRFDPAANGGDGALNCVSCDPTGAAPLGPADFENMQEHETGMLLGPGLSVLTRNLSASGDNVFFETPDKLLVADTNGDAECPRARIQDIFVRTCEDVYEWEAEGSGSCHSSSANGGCLYLISTGASREPSFLAGVSASGSDVFIYTSDQLVSQDRDQLTDLYDARVGGGLPSQQQTGAPACSGDGCQGQPSAPPLAPSIAASVTFNGPGNLTSPISSAKSKLGLLTRGQRLVEALNTCRSKQNRHKRVLCERQARKRYGPKSKKKASHSTATRKGSK
jgi:hypothetical protein